MLKKGFCFKFFFEKIRFFENEGNKKLIVKRGVVILLCFNLSLIVNGYSLLVGCRSIVSLIVNGYSLIGGCRPFTIYNYDSPITINY